VLSLFIDYDGNIEDIAEKTSELLGVKLTKEIDEIVDVHRYIFRFLDIEFILFDNHELEDDCGIAFSEYNYVLDIIKLYSGEKYKMHDDVYNNISLLLTEKLSHAFSSNVMLVDNLQSIILSTVATP
jgi:hypothetical protein